MSAHSPDFRPRTPHGVRFAGPPEHFQDQLYEQFRKAPWVLCSLAAHGVVIGLLLLIPPSEAEVRAQAAVVHMRTPDEVDPLEEPEPPKV